MRPGRKVLDDLDPLDLSGLPVARAARRIAFIEAHCMVTKGKGAGEIVKLRPFQKQIIKGAYAKKVRTGLVSMPRANGKTALAAMLAVAELFAGGESPEVLVVASDERQARITMNLAKRMIEMNPDLQARTMVYRDKLVVPETNGQLIPLPADPSALHGWDPSLLIVDELHTVTEPVWEAVTSVTGKRPESLTLAISTPAATQDSIMWKLVEHGREGTDPAFFLKEFAAPEGCATDDEAAWKIGNPAMACQRPFLAADGLAAARKTLREPVFRQLRLGQWVTSLDSWLPHGAWDAIADPSRVVPDGEKIVMAFDGSASGDSTVLVGCTVEDPHLFIVDMWENPDDPRWRVPRAEVDRAVDRAFERWDVVELACDPWGWRSEIEAWADRHGETHVIHWDTSFRKRMAPATDQAYQAIMQGEVTHDGDSRLAAHIAHTVAESTSLGDLVKKDRRNSPRKIDAAVASIAAYDRATFHAKKKQSGRVYTF
ncbi:MAG: terminase large subunit domain-containing protein [Actinomycetota bacterium]